MFYHGTFWEDFDRLKVEFNLTIESETGRDVIVPDIDALVSGEIGYDPERDDIMVLISKIECQEQRHGIWLTVRGPYFDGMEYDISSQCEEAFRDFIIPRAEQAGVPGVAA